jgi:hypothetical protein
MDDPRIERPTGQRNLDEAMTEIAGNLGLDFVGEMAKRVFMRLWLDPEERRRKLLEMNRTDV